MTSGTSWLRLLRFPIRFITFQKNAYVWSRFKKLRFHVSPVSLALFWYFLLGLESGTGKKLHIHTTGLSRGFLTQAHIYLSAAASKPPSSQRRRVGWHRRDSESPTEATITASLTATFKGSLQSVTLVTIAGPQRHRFLKSQ